MFHKIIYILLLLPTFITSDKIIFTVLTVPLADTVVSLAMRKKYALVMSDFMDKNIKNKALPTFRGYCTFSEIA